MSRDCDVVQAAIITDLCQPRDRAPQPSIIGNPREAGSAIRTRTVRSGLHGQPDGEWGEALRHISQGGREIILCLRSRGRVNR
jgi:hypothetical protein